MPIVKNRASLLSQGNVRLREIALEIAEAAIASANPEQAVHRAVGMDGDVLRVGDRRIDLSGGRRVYVIGAGKACFSIARALDAILGPRIAAGLVTCKYGQEGALEHVRIHHASHPIPDEESVRAAAESLCLVDRVRPGDVVFACFTGGSSSLFVAPEDGITLRDKQETTRVLLTCGANILEINAVRKHLSKVKGGRLARRLPAGAMLFNLTVSDVIGDHLDYVTDPTVPDTSSFADAQAVLDRYGLWERLPASVAAHIRRQDPLADTVRADGLSHLDRTDLLLVHTDAACRAAARKAQELGLRPVILSTLFEGESSALGRNLAAIGKQILVDGNPFPAPCVLIGGGETTVTVAGTAGQGGPNQEFAVGAALELAGTEGIVALGIDTDGTDGPTRYAGGIVDGTTVGAGRRAGVDFHAALQRHDVSPALEATGHIIETGATGTNVNDLKLLVVGAGG